MYTIVHYLFDLFWNFGVQKGHKSAQPRSQHNLCNKLNLPVIATHGLKNHKQALLCVRCAVVLLIITM